MPDAIRIAQDVLYPRTPEERYRIYAVRGRTREVIATCATPEAVGLALITLHEDQKAVGRRLADLGRIGVLDVLAGPRGEWILLPYTRNAPPAANVDAIVVRLKSDLEYHQAEAERITRDVLDIDTAPDGAYTIEEDTAESYHQGRAAALADAIGLLLGKEVKLYSEEGGT